MVLPTNCPELSAVRDATAANRKFGLLYGRTFGSPVLTQFETSGESGNAVDSVYDTLQNGNSGGLMIRRSPDRALLVPPVPRGVMELLS